MKKEKLPIKLSHCKIEMRNDSIKELLSKYQRCANNEAVIIRSEIITHAFTNTKWQLKIKINKNTDNETTQWLQCFLCIIDKPPNMDNIQLYLHFSIKKETNDHILHSRGGDHTFKEKNKGRGYVRFITMEAMKLKMFSNAIIECNIFIRKISDKPLHVFAQG